CALPILVPLMLAMALAFVALRRPSLYPAQTATPGQSPVHRDALLVEALEAVPVGDVLTLRGPPVSFEEDASGEAMQELVEAHREQDLFPVVNADGVLVGVVRAVTLRVLWLEGSAGEVVARDVMQAPVSVRPDEDMRRAAERLLAHGLRQLPVVDRHGRPVGLLDEHAVARLALQGSAGLARAATP